MKKTEKTEAKISEIHTKRQIEHFLEVNEEDEKKKNNNSNKASKKTRAKTVEAKM